MDIKIKNSSEIPIYAQIVNEIKKLIVTDIWKAGEALPSIRQLAKDLGVSVITTKRAFEDLEKAGFIETIPGKGSFVKVQSEDFHREIYLTKIQTQLEEVLNLAKMANISKEDIFNMIDILEGGF